MSIYKIFSVIGVVVLFGGCTAAKQNEWFLNHAGNMPAKERVEKIKIGETKDTVIAVLGLPSSVNAFDENSWIYMSSDIKKMAFFAPEEKERNILHITFNQSGEVSDIKFLSLEDGKKIKVEKDQTEVKGQRIGFFRKYFGGVGQYSPFGGKKNSF